MATITTIKERIAAMDQASFQILCDSYLSKEGYPNIVALGTKAGTQKTTPGTPDTYFFVDEKYIFVEYTTQQSALVAKIENDLNKCLDESATGISVADISEIIYCHTSSNIAPGDDKKFRDRCEALGINLTILGIDVLSEQLLNKHPKLVKDHLGLTIDTEQIQKVEDFISQYNSNGLAAPLDTPFLFREKEFEEIATALTTKSVVVLTGSAGIGKTKMALEYARKHAEQFNETMYCIHDRALPMNDDLCAYLEKPGSYFLVVDDANQISNLAIIVDYVNKQHLGYSVKVIITVRDYAIDKIKYSLGQLTAYEIISVKPFSNDQIKELVRTSLGILNEDYLDRIVRIAEGNARMAILAGKIAYQTNRLDSINDVTQLYKEYYGRVLSDSELQSNAQLLKSAGIIAFLNSLHLDKLDALNELFSNNGLSAESFIAAMYKLHELEIVDIYHDKAVRISEQCFSNFILKYVFYDKKILSLSEMIAVCFNPYRSRVIHSVNTIVGVFRDKSIHAFVETEIKTLWKKLSTEKAPNFMEFIKAFHGVDSTETSIILNNLIDNMEAVDIPVTSIDTTRGKNYQSIDDDILYILGAYADSEELDCVLDLFFKYYLKHPDKYIQFYHAINVYYNVNVDSWKHGYITQIKLTEKFVQYSDNWKNEYILLLFCDIVPNLLSLHFSPLRMASRGNSFVIYNIFLRMSEGVFEYRKLLWEQLLSICSNNKDTVKSILYRYGQSFEEACYDVMKSDFVFIEKIINAIFSTEVLADSIIVHHIRGVFEEASIKSDAFDIYENSPKMKIYQLLSGPRISLELKHDEREKIKEKQIQNYVDSEVDKSTCFKTLFSICKEATGFKDAHHYDVHNGLYIALLHICNDKELFVSTVSFAIQNGYVEYLSPRMIISKLFELLSPNEIIELIHRIESPSQQNIWEYNFYHELPEKIITQSIVDDFYLFLSKQGDSGLEASSYRDITFLKKYEKIDSNIILNSARIIFAKKEYSKFMVKIYFDMLFNQYRTSPKEVISFFEKDIYFLENLYLWFEENDDNHDYDGEYLLALYRNNNAFLIKYIHKAYEITPKYKLDYRFRKCRVFFECNNYQEVFNTIINEILSISQHHIREVADVIECFAIKTKGEDVRTQKSTVWILQYIDNNALDKERMQCVFEACSNIDVERRLEFVSCFLKHNNDFEFFKSLTLTDYPSGGWSGSIVRIYTSWIEYYKKLLPLLTGLTFINHKKLIQDRIDDIQQWIVNAEISEILESSDNR